MVEGRRVQTVSGVRPMTRGPVLVLAVLVLGVSIILGSSASAQTQPIGILVNGTPVHLKMDPVIISNQVFLPLRELFTLLNSYVTWVPETQGIVAFRGDIVIGLKVGNAVADVNDSQVTLPAAPRMINGTAFVPLRAVAFLLGAQISYSDRTVSISIPAFTAPDRTPSRYAELIDQYARDGYKGRYVWVKSHDGPLTMSLYEAGRAKGSVLVNHLEKLRILEISLIEDSADNPWVNPKTDRKVILQNSKGQTVQMIIDDPDPWDGVFQYREAIEHDFYLEDPFKGRNWSKETWDLIKANRIRIGMTADMVRMSWGNPQDINRTVYSFGVYEQWVYGLGCYVYFENGVVTAIQD